MMQATVSKTDIVTQYLRSQGKHPQPAYFNNSQFIIGWRIALPELELIYRVEQQQLIICDFIAGQQETDAGKAVLAFIKLIHQIERALPQLSLVRGMLLDSPHPELNELRQRLNQALLNQGASWQEIEGDSWLVYPVRGKKK